MSRDEQETVWLEIEVFHTTEKAILIDEGPGAMEKWLAKSQVKDFSVEPRRDRIEDFERGDRAKVEVPVWYVEKHGFDDWVTETP